MSGGQRRRIVLARTLAADPRILILDDATSGLDSQTEADIVARLRAATRDRTTILITHRPA
ncbi:ATP-binding cassette domain-containing protein, partial [Streptomyces sp. NPDC057136]|uniref:ATP-binding cassette domain-containing protein n=1 Tax=Streptomyces sp. NPDC057136 TaxID=3346029 RepID=UPI00363B45D9